jgi:acyl-CoA synthetase (AMP-forming)/AMP-acid ligase II
MSVRPADVPVHPAELLHTLLERARSDAPEAGAVRDGNGGWTYAELAGWSRAVRCWLDGHGVGHGDRVLVALPSARPTVALLFGVCARGAVFVPVNPAMTAFQLRFVLADAEPAVVIVTAGALAWVRELTGAPVYDLKSVWAEVAALRGRNEEPRPVPVRGTDPALLIYTSGSTAMPKAVVCPHAQVSFATRSLGEVLGYRADDVVFCRFALSWDYGIYKVLLCALARAQLVLAGEDSALTLVRRMRECGATVLPIVPSLGAMVATLARRDPAGAPRLRLITNTGAALPAPVLAQLRAAFPAARVVRMFGQTECKRITVMPPELADERPGSVGVALPGTRVRVVDEHGRPLPAGRTGEIVVTGPHVMAGYWRLPELTARTFRRDPATGVVSLHTGDFGRLDEDGFLYFEGRRDDMFKRRGSRMSVLEIEAAALDLPGVRAAAVLPPTDRRDLAIWVATELPADQVLLGLAARLEPAKVPAICRVLGQLPLSVNGKPDLAALAAMLETVVRVAEPVG